MIRLLAVIGLGVGLSACVTVPGEERPMASFSNGVKLTQRLVTYWEGLSPFDRREAWARNDSGAVQCLALKASNTPGYAKIWTLRPGANETMWPEMSEYSSNRYVAGQYGSWTPVAGDSCDAAPPDLDLVRLRGG